MPDELVIEAIGLEKSYGSVRVLAGVDLDVARGSVLALLGPNGAGKTTTVRILATLGRPDAGQARVAGFDVVTDRRQVRRRISLTGQFAALDELQTGEENLRMMGRLSGLSGARGPPPRRRAAGAVRPGRGRPPHGGDLVGRHAPAPRPGRQPGRPALGDLPGRAHHRAGPAQPPGGVAGRDRPRRVGGDDLPHHPVPGGGGPAGRPHRRPRRRPGGRRRHLGGSSSGRSPASAWISCWPTPLPSRTPPTCWAGARSSATRQASDHRGRHRRQRRPRAGPARRGRPGPAAPWSGSPSTAPPSTTCSWP